MFVAVDTPRSDTATMVGTLPDIDKRSDIAVADKGPGIAMADKGPGIAMVDKGLDIVGVGIVARKTIPRPHCSMAVDTQETKGFRTVESRRSAGNCY